MKTFFRIRLSAPARVAGIIVSILFTGFTAAFAADAPGPIGFCTAAFSPGKTDALDIYVKMTEQGVLLKHIDLVRVEEIVKALENGTVLNPFESLPFKSTRSGWKAAAELLIGNSDLKAKDLLPMMRELLVQLSGWQEKQDVAREETREILSFRDFEKIDSLSRAWKMRVITHPDGRFFLIPDKGDGFEVRESIELYEVSGLTSKKTELRSPSNPSLFIGFDKNGDDLWALESMHSRGPRDITYDIKIVNMRTGDSQLIATGSNRDELRVHVRTSPQGEHFLVVKRFKFAYSPNPLAGITFVSINDPAAIHKVPLPEGRIYQGLEEDRIYRNSSGAFVYQYGLRNDNSDQTSPWYQWTQGADPVKFQPVLFPLHQSRPFTSSTGKPQTLTLSNDNNGELEWSIFDIDSNSFTTHKPPVPSQDAFASKIFYTAGRPQIALRMSYMGGIYKIFIVDIETREKEEFVLRNMSDGIDRFISFRTLRGDRLAVTLARADVGNRIVDRVLVHNLDHRESYQPEILLPPDTYIMEYIPEPGHERLLIRSDRAVWSYKIYAPPPSAEVEP